MKWSIVCTVTKGYLLYYLWHPGNLKSYCITSKRIIIKLGKRCFNYLFSHKKSTGHLNVRGFLWGSEKNHTFKGLKMSEVDSFVECEVCFQRKVSCQAFLNEYSKKSAPGKLIHTNEWWRRYIHIQILLQFVWNGIRPLPIWQLIKVSTSCISWRSQEPRAERSSRAQKVHLSRNDPMSPDQVRASSLLLSKSNCYSTILLNRKTIYDMWMWRDVGLKAFPRLWVVWTVWIPEEYRVKISRDVRLSKESQKGNIKIFIQSRWSI